MKICLTILAGALSVFAPGICCHAGEPVTAASVDAVFSHLTPSQPGCAVGIESPDNSPILRAYGTADLEHSVPIRLESMFEAGSVSKQFTAAATLVLIDEHRLSLTDDARKYLPELPDYGHPITIAELMEHTSGLRDWEQVAAIAGWPLGERIYKPDDVLRMTARQRTLNSPPGSAWSYTNTGYSLLAMIIERVSGMPLTAFSQEHLFKPLGMTHTQWRDDFRRVVPDRVIAYHHNADGAYQLDMPFHDTYGQGGLLTTIGDLLIWNRALNEQRLGEFVTRELQRSAHLSDGREVGYARGLFISTYRGTREAFHDGFTAGYRAWLGRFDQRVSIAILCNAGSAYDGGYARALANLYLPETETGAASTALPATAAPATLAGWYASQRNGLPLHLIVQNGRLQTSSAMAVQSGSDHTLLQVRSDGRVASRGVNLEKGRLSFESQGDTTIYVREPEYHPTAQALAKIAGRYRSAEADATFRVTVAPDGLHVEVEDRADSARVFAPIYSGAFLSASSALDDEDTVLRPVYDKSGAVIALRISDDRVWDMRFDRLH